MSNNSIGSANRYFKICTKKVYIERCHNIESFEEYLNHKFRDNQYFYSAYALMGLKPYDSLVRGYIDLIGCRNYAHGWVEFNFSENEYIFDPMIEGVVLKRDWYEYFNPKISYQKTQADILDEYLNEKNAVEIAKGFWQFKCLVMNSSYSAEYSIHNYKAYDANNWFVPTSLMLSRIIIAPLTSEITRFIAYSEPSGY